MARTIIEIRDLMLQQKAGIPALNGLSSTSATAIWRLVFYIVATAIWSLEKINDLLRLEIDETIATLKPHSLRWYAFKAKAFQYGFALVPEADYYDNSAVTEDEVNDSKIVSYAAVVEQERGVRIKVAKTVGEDLGPLAGGELAAFTTYMQEVKDAGVRLNITTGPADSLRLVLKIIYDSLVLDSEGARRDGSEPEPIKAAIKYHLKNLPFNGIFSVQKLIDVIQNVEGVKDLSVNEVQTKYGALNFSTVNIKVIPDAGYLRIADADLLITYEAE